MPDSIFDLKQTLFTSNLPGPPPRDRGSDKATDFDQALDSAQRQSRDEQRAHQSQQPPAANNRKSEETDQTNAANDDGQDQVTLSEEGSKTAETPPANPAIPGKKPERDYTADESAAEPTADEIATAVVGTEAPPKPVLKVLPKAENAEQPEGIELNDAIQFGAKRGRGKTGDKSIATSATATNAAPVNDEQVAVATDLTVTVDPNAVVVAAEQLATKIAAEKKNERTANKTEQPKPVSTKTKHTDETEANSEGGEHADGAFAVTVTPEIESDAPSPKRRLETTRQSLPEVHDNELKAASTFAVNAAAASTASATTITETTANTAETPALSAVPVTPTETPPPANHPRGQQIPNSFANRLEAASAERKANDGLNGVDRTRFVQRVARAFQRAGETEGEIRLRLSPPELGALKLEVTLRDGAMVARMETETTAARNLLMENLPQLKERLAEQNVRIETFEVEVRDQSRHDGAEDAKEQLRQQQEQQRNRLRGERATTPVVAAPIVRTLPAARQSSQLNVVI